MPSETTMQLDSSSTLTTQFGAFLMQGFVDLQTQAVTVTLSTGDIEKVSLPLVRIHSKCVTSEAMSSMQCDCAAQLDLAMQRIQTTGAGIIIYLDQEARGNGTRAKLKIYEAMQKYHVTSSEACELLGYAVDSRTYGDAAAILRYYNVTAFRLLTNNPDKLAAMCVEGFTVQREPIVIPPNKHNLAYLRDKQEHFHHDLGIFIDSN